jgi:hypothetical protein
MNGAFVNAKPAAAPEIAAFRLDFLGLLSCGAAGTVDLLTRKGE